MKPRNTVRPSLLALGLSIIAFTSNCLAQNAVSWSQADAGLRLGLSTDEPSTRAGNLLVALDNVGQYDLSVFAGMNDGKSVTYQFEFVAIAPDGTQYRIWDIRPEETRPVAGLVIPNVIYLAPGASYQLAFPLTDLVYMAKATDTTLDVLLQRGFTLMASFEVQQRQLNGALMGKIPSATTARLWTGRLTISYRLPALRH